MIHKAIQSEIHKISIVLDGVGTGKHRFVAKSKVCHVTLVGGTECVMSHPQSGDTGRPEPAKMVSKPYLH